MLKTTLVTTLLLLTLTGCVTSEESIGDVAVSSSSVSSAIDSSSSANISQSSSLNQSSSSSNRSLSSSSITSVGSSSLVSSLSNSSISSLFSSSSMSSSVALNSDKLPVANAQEINLFKNSTKDIILTGEGSSSSLRYTIITQPRNGKLSGTTPNITYAPNANYIGSDSFTFKVSSKHGDSAVGTISINILLKDGQVFANSNVKNENYLENTQLFYFNFSYDIDIKKGRDYFKPYLAYLDRDGKYIDAMMDSFVFLDLSIQHRKGRYNKRYWNHYLDTVFKRTKLPVIHQEGRNSFGLLDKYRSTLSFKTNANLSSGKYTLTLDKKLFPNSLTPQTGVSNKFIIGLNYFDKNNKEIYKKGSTYSDWLKMYVSYIPIDATELSWKKLTYTFNAPEGTRSLKFHLINWESSNSIGVDNVVLSNEDNVNFIDNSESAFDKDSLTTKWELDTKVGIKYLFGERDALIDELNSANIELHSKVPNLPITKLILTMPNIDIRLYQNEIDFNKLKHNIKSYLDEVETRFHNWSEKQQDRRVELAGIYILDEGLSNSEYRLYRFIKDQVEEKNWLLYGSPYLRFGGKTDSISTTFAPRFFELLDTSWQQPGAWYRHTRRGNVDRDMLKNANEIASQKGLSINIENRVRTLSSVLGEEKYGRVNDYFDYGDKYGYINYSKMYYDDAGAHYINAFSSDPKNRVDYDNLYKFIKKSNHGVVINNKFEIKDSKDKTKLYNWDGAYKIAYNNISSSSRRELKFTTVSEDTILSGLIPIDDDKQYHISFKAKEDIDDKAANSAYIGVFFFDTSDRPLSESLSDSDLEHTSSSKEYYRYLDTTSTFKNYSIKFKPPIGAAYFKFYLKNNKNANIEWKSLKFYQNSKMDQSSIIYKNSTSRYLQFEKKRELGNYSLKLDSGNVAFSSEKISISSNRSYKLKLEVKGESSTLQQNNQNRALVAIETFNSGGDKIGRSISNWSHNTSIDKRYKYIPFNQNWNEFAEQITFAHDVASIKIYLYNMSDQNSILLDNITFNVIGSQSLIRTIDDDNNNLLSRVSWSEKLPLTLRRYEPVLYNDFIDVSDKKELEFSALVRGAGSYPQNKELLAVEFYDKNYNLLLLEDIENTNLNYSDSYKYWWGGYMGITYISPDEYISMDTNTSALPNWYTTQWREYKKSFTIPKQVSYMRLSLHKTSGDGEMLILNPNLHLKPK